MNLLQTSILFLFLGLWGHTQTFAQEVTIFPSFLGQQYYEDDVQISKKEFASLMNSNDVSKEYYEKAKRHFNYSVLSGAAYLGFSIWQIYALNNGDNLTIPLIGGVASLVASIGFSFSSISARKNAILSYNNGLDGGISLHLSSTKNGTGLVLSF